MEVSTKLGRVSIVPRGEYDPSEVYARLDVVQHGGSGYLVLRPVQGVTPEDGEDYMLLVKQGDPGKAGGPGPKGDPGGPGPQGKGFVIKGYYLSLEDLESAVPSPEEGDSYGVGIAAPYNICTWDVVHKTWVNNGTIQGPAGKSAYQYAKEGGYAGTEAQFGQLMANAVTKQYVDDRIGDIGAILDSINGEVA